MDFKVKKRGKLTYYSEEEHPEYSLVVTEEQPDGDLKIYLAGVTGGHAAQKYLGHNELVTMDPEKEIPLVFKCWELWLQKANICDSIQAIDFVEMHVFTCQPKSPNPLVDPAGYAVERERLWKAYVKTYREFFKEQCPDNGVPARFTVHLNDVPDKAASYEFYSVGLFQKSLQK